MKGQECHSRNNIIKRKLCSNALRDSLQTGNIFGGKILVQYIQLSRPYEQLRDYLGQVVA